MRNTMVMPVLLLATAGASAAGPDTAPTEPQRGWLGVMTEDLSPAMLAALGIEHGVLVGEALRDGPALKAGLKTGDVILDLDREKTSNGSDLRMLVRDRAGKSVRLTVWRKGKARTFQVTLGSTADGLRFPISNWQLAIPNAVRTFRKALSELHPRIEEVVEVEQLSFDSLRVQLDELKRELRELREQLRERGKGN